MKDYSFFNKIILRTPLQEVETDISWEKIQVAFRSPLYREALFVASPHLYDLLLKFEEDPENLEKRDIDSLKISLYKYYSRFSNRCTPFGLFAYVSDIKLGRENKFDIKQESIRKATKFDTFFLANLLAFIDKAPEIRSALFYKINSTLYAVSDKFRYVEYYFKEEIRLHKISGVDQNVYLEKIVKAAQESVQVGTLVDALCDENISKEQAEGFIHTLIDNQFLVSELEITLTGDDYLELLVKKFSEPRFQFFEGQEILSLLLDLQARLKQLESLDSKVSDYLSLFEYVNKNFDKVPIKKLFQVDGYREMKDNQLSYSVLKQLRAAVKAVEKLSSKPPKSTLQHFIDKFVERYEEQEMPLTKVLDPDIGINYAKNLSAKAPLVEGLYLQPRKGEVNIPWDKAKSHMFRQLLSAYQKNEKEIVLTDKDLDALDEQDNGYFDTFSVFFNAFSENEEEKIYLRTVWGPTANNLIGRFCHLDEDIYNLSAEIGEMEEKLLDDKLVAEIIHLPQARTGNVLHRKNQRSYEIPYLGQSSLPQDNQIPISDIMISVRNGQIKLRSARHNKEIIPRLSNAHNFSADALPIYHFLCDYQMMNKGLIGYSWGQLQYEYPYLPRVSYKNIVVSRATWVLSPQDIKQLTKNKNKKQFLTDFVERRQIPEVVSLAAGDNEVVINFSNELSRDVFFSLIKNKAFIELKEFFFQEPSITGSYANEFIASVHRNPGQEEQRFVIPVGDYQDDEVKTHFSIGDEWLYYKFYCGDKIAETILNEGIFPAVLDLENKELIDKWFFIRYSDRNGFHIRFRIKLKDKAFFNDCINSINYHVGPLEENGLIWKIQIDTYQRESERYGYHSIDLSESFFHLDSRCTLQFTSLIEGEAGEQVRWLFSLLSMDRLLEDFDFTLEQKAGVLKMLKLGFGAEFNRKGLLNKQINDLYTAEEEKIEQFLDRDKMNPIYDPLWKILDQRSADQKEFVSQLLALEKEKKMPQPLLIGIIPSYLHMICNRVFLNKQRVHEMVVYDFLYKYYNKKLHTSKQTSSDAVHGQK